ncbi:MAG: aspartate carbamoyltransferase regulatory subunit [Nitrososphaerota archaeon]
MSGESLLVRKIDWGTVLDHIPAWRANQVLKLLNLESLNRSSDISVIVLYNVPSKKLGRKDIVKLYHHMVSEEEAKILALVFPQMTINYIRDWKVEKHSPGLPEKIIGKIRCPETTCITNYEREPATPRYIVEREHGVVVCEYCDTLLEISRIPDFLKG